MADRESSIILELQQMNRNLIRLAIFIAFTGAGYYIFEKGRDTATTALRASSAADGHPAQGGAIVQVALPENLSSRAQIVEQVFDG